MGFFFGIFISAQYISDKLRLMASAEARLRLGKMFGHDLIDLDLINAFMANLVTMKS